MPIFHIARIASIAFALAAVSAIAEDNALTPEEEAAGWRLLFDGESFDGWMCNNGKPIAAPIENGALVPFQSGGYLIVHEERHKNFVLRCEVKMSSEKCNSGVFFRVSDLANPVQSGFEAQVSGRVGQSSHHFGAIYDLAPTSMGAFTPEDWNALEIKCYDSRIQIRVNGKKVSEIDANDFPVKGQRPDGSKHKFGVIKDMARTGYLGFQDHGHKVWYKNVKLLPLSD